MTYRADVTPTFSGTGTLNGAAFSSGQTISEDGSYTLTVTNDYNLSTTVNFTLEKISSNISSLNYSRKKAKQRVTFIFYGITSNSRMKKSWVSLRLGGRKVKIARVSSMPDAMRVDVNLKYKGWPPGLYDLTMNYRIKNGKSWQRGTTSKRAVLTIN
ncbi:MAG: hypothetical protein FJZ04_03050 [Candidatus Moranbacteria bacterium]|nr:hypothetical protein [Candidatus Moranbacteria bacterium]